MKTGSLLAIVLFSLIALAHLLRLLYRVPATVDGYPVPLWVSAVGVVVPAAVAFLLWREADAAGGRPGG